jgi:hypothetical protein
MKKLKLKMFLNLGTKSKVQVGSKAIKLREERELLGRFLIIQQSRPELFPKLETVIGTYELSVVPRSLCAVDGSLYLPTDKAVLMHHVENYGNMLNSLPEPQESSRKVIIVDAMAVMQCITKTPSMVRLLDMQNSFLSRIESLVKGYTEANACHI